MGYRDATLVPLRELSVPVVDTGLMHGVCVSEQVRTLGGRPFLLDRHYARWQRGLELIGLEPPCNFETLESRIANLIQLNARLLPGNSEQGVCFFATPGDQPALVWQISHHIPSDQNLRRTTRFFAHTYPLPIDQWQASYETGVALVTTPIRDVPSQSWPKDVKIRSRLHYYLAQRAADARSTGAYPILLGGDGHVADSAIASIAGYTHDDGLIVKPPSERFASISLEYAVELARKIDLPVTERNFSVDELKRFDEVFLVSTPWCLFPVATIDGHAISPQHTFPIYQRLMAAFR